MAKTTSYGSTMSMGGPNQSPDHRRLITTLAELLQERGADRNNNFLLLRLAAAMSVVVGHSFPLSPKQCETCIDHLRAVGSPVPLHGLGVLVFFAISGFLILRSATTQGLQAFVRSRLLRILPGLAVCVVLTAFVIGPIYSTLRVEDYFGLLSPYDYVLRAISFTRHPAFELPGVAFTSTRFGTTVNGSLWTIPLEMRLYILAAIVALASRYLRVPAWVAILSIVLLAAAVDTTTIVPDEDGYRLAWLFGLGASMFACKRWIPMHWTVMLLILLAWLISRGTTVEAAAFNLLVAYGTMYLAFLPKLVLPPGIRDYSYGIYLYAFPIQQMVGHAFPSFGPYALMTACIPLVWMAGMASWFAVESPALKFKPRGVHERGAIEAIPRAIEDPASTAR